MTSHHLAEQCKVQKIINLCQIETDIIIISDSETLTQRFTITETDTMDISESEVLIKTHVISATDIINLLDTPPFGRNGGGGTGSGFNPAYEAELDLARILQTLMINEISYDVCDENTARILIASDDVSIPTVTVETKSGTVIAILAAEQPFNELNAFTTVDRYLFETPLEPGTESFTVYVEYAVGEKIDSVSSTIQITECEHIITFEEIPETFGTVQIFAPQIYDVKFQIDNGTKQSADISSETIYLDNQDLTVSALVTSLTSIKQAELRYSTTDMPTGEFNSVPMEINPQEHLDGISVVSATISSDVLLPPSVTYWIHVIDVNTYTQESKHYIIGIKPISKSNVSIELDITTSKPEGSIIRPTAYVTNHGTDLVLARVSLQIQGDIVSSQTVLLGQNQVVIPLEWKIPKVGKQMTYDVQAIVDLYDTTVSTEIAKLNSFMKTQKVSLSQMTTIDPLTDNAGKIIAEPELIYVSDYYNNNLRLAVYDQEGKCMVGGSESCEVQDSTFNEREGKLSFEHKGIILNVLYSGPHSPLERASLASADPIPQELLITLEPLDKPVDEFIPPAFALEDTELNIKYRTISEIVTVRS